MLHIAPHGREDDDYIALPALERIDGVRLHTGNTAFELFDLASVGREVGDGQLEIFRAFERRFEEVLDEGDLAEVVFGHTTLFFFDVAGDEYAWNGDALGRSGPWEGISGWQAHEGLVRIGEAGAQAAFVELSGWEIC